MDLLKFTQFKMDTQWYKDLLSGKRGRSASDTSYLDNNGAGPKIFLELLKVLGK